MSTPATAATYADKVNAVISQVQRSEDGKLTFPEGISEDLQYAATAEIRRRDTQSHMTKVSQRAAALENTVNAMSEELEAAIVSTATVQQQAELAELKASDPDAWRLKLIELEKTAKGTAKTKIDQLRSTGDAQVELERRAASLKEFKEANPGFDLNDDIIANELPPRLVKQLADGKIDFDNFLVQAKKFLDGEITVAKNEPGNNLPDLGKAAGGSKPGSNDKPDAKAYKDEVY